ncbi:MAG: hypothetical protein A2X57_05765 [Nitrospirae bacterium GWD2_57_8]|nr:MAG: hypothetical protein A2X57_05765 [Nitrospirae bacterium GWD2_57_8]
MIKTVAACAMLLVVLQSIPARAEIKVIEAESVYLMGDNDSKIDARRIAVQEAKRKALEEAGTFVASLTEGKDYKLTKDEVTAYTAGVVETEIAAEEMRGSTAKPEMFVRVRCRIDTDVMNEQISRFREHEDLKEQLTAAHKENETLRKERESLVRKLHMEKSGPKAGDIQKKLDSVLSKEEANDDVRNTWASLSRKMDFVDAGYNGNNVSPEELERATTLVQRAASVNPDNRRARILLAMLYQRRGDPDAAEKILRSSAATHPANPFYHMKLGLLLKERGRHNEALKEFHLVEKVRPRDPRMLFHSGMTHYTIGNCRQSASYLTRFLKIAQNAKRPVVQKMKGEALQAVQDCRDRMRQRGPDRRPHRQLR